MRRPGRVRPDDRLRYGRILLGHWVNYSDSGYHSRVKCERSARPLRVPAPWEQVIDLCDLVVGDAGEGVFEPGVGIDGVELRGFDQGLGDGGGIAACF